MVLGRNDIVVNRYEILDRGGVVVEGFVAHDNQQFAFKGLLDLNDPNQTLVFAPAAVQAAPSDAQLLDLRGLNDRIMLMGGTDELSAPDASVDSSDVSPEMLDM